MWYESNPDDMDEFEKQMRRKVHYVIQPQYLWGSIAEMARTQNEELLQHPATRLQVHRERILCQHLPGLVLGDQPGLGKTGQEAIPSAMPSSARSSPSIAEGLAQFSTDSDTLGDAYEYLIGQFAAGSGKKAGEFYTPQQISSILSAIVTLDSQDPHRQEENIWIACSTSPAAPAHCC